MNRVLGLVQGLVRRCARRKLGFATSVTVASHFCFSAVTSIGAAPVVFQFEATISDVQGNVASLNLPFSLAVGQPIGGRFTFQSEDDLLDIFLHHERGKHGLVSLSIDGTRIEGATNFGSLSAGVLDPPVAGPTSAIYLDYISPTDVFPGWPGSVGGHPWSQRLILLGAAGTITDPDQLLEVDVWNQLTLLRRVDLQFGYPNTVSVQVIAGDFVAVPEPSSAWLV